MAIDATAETFDKDVQGSMTVVDFWAQTMLSMPKKKWLNALQ